MRAVRNSVDGIGTVTVPDPRPSEAVVAVVSAGICASDLHMAGWGPLPHTLGHEIGGLLDAMPVAVDPSAPCHECAACRSGQPNRCELGVRGLGIDRDGGMADQVDTTTTRCVPLPPSIDPRDACLAEPLAVGVHAVERGQVERGHRVAVVGAGSIGLCVVVAAQAAGAEVDVEARHDHQREAVEALGARNGLGAGYDVVFECAGSESAVARAVQVSARGGHVVSAATYWDGLVVDGLSFCTKELTISAAMGYCGHADRSDFASAVSLLARRPDVPQTLITHRFSLDESAEAFRVAATRESKSIKVVLHP